MRCSQTMDDLRAVGCDLLTLGQYLRPTVNHLPVERFVTPEEFAELREAALARGFLECVSGPLVRSSYRAERALAGNNCGITLMHPFPHRYQVRVSAAPEGEIRLAGEGLPELASHAAAGVRRAGRLLVAGDAAARGGRRLLRADLPRDRPGFAPRVARAVR